MRSTEVFDKCGIEFRQAAASPMSKRSSNVANLLGESVSLSTGTSIWSNRHVYACAHFWTSAGRLPSHQSEKQLETVSLRVGRIHLYSYA
jgi:hypothetical protein